MMGHKKRGPKMRYLVIFIFLFSTSPVLSAWKPTGNNLVRFVCQGYSGGEPYNEVIVIEQLSVDTVDGSLHIVPDEIEGGLGEENRFRMKMHLDSSLISSERTKKEIIRDLLTQPASLNSYDGTRMEYEGVGLRWMSEFNFVSDDESRIFDMHDLRNLEAFLENGAAGAFLQCEEPELFPEKVWVEG